MSTASGTSFGYRIQARAITDLPVIIEVAPIPTAITKERWTTLSTTKVREGWGVANPIWNRIADEQGLLCYSTAIALMAKMESELGRFSGVEFRLLQQKLTYSWEIEDVGTTESFTFDDRERGEKITRSTDTPEGTNNGK